jgi:hypothetical protein
MIQFDVYVRDLKTEGPTRKVVVYSYLNTFSVENGLTLCKVPMSVTIVSEERALTVSKQTPEPLTVVNTPPPHVVLGFYEFLPQVIGGVGPYEFTIEGMDETFEFNSSTGELSRRPPQ